MDDMSDFFGDKGNIINSLRNLSANEAQELLQHGAILIDVREKFMLDMKMFDVPHQLNFPITRLINSIEGLPQDKALIFADATGVKSKAAHELAWRNGYTNSANLSGGLVDWEKKGFPISSYQKIRVSGKNRCEFIDK